MIDLNELAKTLSPARREMLIAYAMELQTQEEAQPTAVSEAEPENVLSSSDTDHPGGWIEVKTISGRRYEYYRWREGKTLKSKYKGKA